MPKIFYAHSSDEEGTIYKTFKNICDSINKDNIIIINVNNSKEALLIDAITESINECDLFICDITPDYEYFDNILVNSNVMFELGYAYKNILKENIIILLDENKTKKRPSILEGYLYIAYFYDSENTVYCDNIIKVINEKINNIKKNKPIKLSKPEFTIKDIEFKKNDLDKLRTYLIDSMIQPNNVGLIDYNNLNQQFDSKIKFKNFINCLNKNYHCFENTLHNKDNINKLIKIVSKIHNYNNFNNCETYILKLKFPNIDFINYELENNTNTIKI
jgi:hypothetical protein